MKISLDSILASDRLPSLPEVAARIVEIARNPEPDFDRMIEAIRTDPAIAGRILKTANSALLGMRTRASSIEMAVPRLGSTMVRTLVLSFCLAEYQNKNSLNLRPWYQQIWRESLVQAATAEMLAERQPQRIDPANWFLAGLVQDIGRLALLHACRDEYVENVLEVDDDRSQRQREKEWLGFTHVEVGLGLCRRWNLDPEIIDAIAVHHASAHGIVPLKFVSSVSLPAALITASLVAEYLEEVSHNLNCSREQIERLLMQVYGMRPNDIFRMLGDVDQRVSELSAAFGIDVGHAPELGIILTEAQRLLAEIAVASQLRLVNAHASVGRAERIRMAAEEQIVPLGLMFADIDQFKSINDAQGHSAGDLLLQKVAGILRECVRLTDSVVRYGGDEFVILLKDVNVDMLTLIADKILGRIRTELSSTEPVQTITCSLGAVLYVPQESAAVRCEALIKEADLAMYEAKRRGGDRVYVATCEAGKWELAAAGG